MEHTKNLLPIPSWWSDPEYRIRLSFFGSLPSADLDTERCKSFTGQIPRISYILEHGFKHSVE